MSGRSAKRQRTSAPTIVHRRDSVDIADKAGFDLESIGLGLFSALASSRLLWPSEDASLGTGLSWCLWVILAAFTLAVVRFRRTTFEFRWNVADLFVVLCFFVVFISQARALDHRPATNMAWEWAAMGLIYVLARQLPRDNAETSALVWSQLVMVTALATYGLFQNTVEFPELRRVYQANPEKTLLSLGINPDSPSRKAFEDRLLGSNEVMSTFALANSLAGVLVGPLVILFGLLFDQILKPNLNRTTRLARCIPLAILQAVIGLCLLWTKSRSAWLGLVAGVGVTSLFLLRNTRLKYVARLVVPLGFIAIALFLAGLATGRMDLLVLTESVKSLRYRVEYWVATWSIISQGKNWLWGIGPANFSYYYMQFKLPEASEEISDPHNVFLDLWVTAGIFAVIFFALALAMAFIRISATKTRETDYETLATSRKLGKILGFSLAAFLIAPVLGGWNLFQEDLLRRWFVLLVGWLIGWLVSRGVLASVVIRGEHLAAALLATIVTWLAAGGIGFPSVAIGFWLVMATGLNLASDTWRSAPTKVLFDIKLMRFLPIAASVGILGGFLGGIIPFWKAEHARALATEVLEGPSPRVSAARQQLLAAIEADPRDATAFVSLAELEYQTWLQEGSKPEAFEAAWTKIRSGYEYALSLPRNPLAITIWRREAGFIEMMLKKSANRIPPAQQIALTAQRAKCLRTASKLYPNSSAILAQLAEVDHSLGLADQARESARKAIHLSDIMPHNDKKLDTATVAKLKSIAGD